MKKLLFSALWAITLATTLPQARGQTPTLPPGYTNDWGGTNYPTILIGQPLEIGTNLGISSISTTQSGSDYISALGVTNTQAYHGYELVESPYLPNSSSNFVQASPMWVGAGGTAVQNEYATNDLSATNAFFEAEDVTMTVTTTNLVAENSTASGCPGPYSGYAHFYLTDGWGWAPDTNTTIHMISDGEGKTDTHIQYLGEYGDSGCDQTSVSIPTNGLYSPLYEFGIYFAPGDFPTNKVYHALLNGFIPSP